VLRDPFWQAMKCNSKEQATNLKIKRDGVSSLEMFNPRAKKHASELLDIFPLCSIF
jgi:hypothetical protein